MILSGKNVLITGAGRGIGRAIANICAKEGANIAICSRSHEELEKTLTCMKSNAHNDSEKKSNFEMFIVDVTKEHQVDEMVSSMIHKFGNIDILINNAGRGQAEKKFSYEMKVSDLRDIVDLNLVAVHSVTSSVLKKSMLIDTKENQNEESRNGIIINISSRAGKIGIPNMPFYCASKFALEGYSATLALELKDKNILVNTISPGMVDTQSFPKAPGKKGVRTADSIRDGLMLLLQTKKTGHYVHVDELDQVVAKGLDPELALKSINEIPFSVE